MSTWFGKWAATMAAACLLQACGGGSDSSTVDPVSEERAVALNHPLRGQVVTAMSLPVSGAQVRWGSLTLVTDAQGRFEFPASGTTGDAIQVDRSGYAPGIKRLGDSTDRYVAIVLTPTGISQTLKVDAGGAVTDPISGARVDLPAQGLVEHGSQKPAVGDVTVTVTAIDPASNTAAMPGAYLVRAGNGSVAPIESFGALHVGLTDGQGQRLDLASGKRATIQIPVSSRSAQPPATIPLLYLDEPSGVWVFDGQAELKGTAPSWYYEGSVSHFTYWNADIALDTVYVASCLIDEQGRPVPQRTVFSEGLDYTGMAQVETDAQGRFKLPVRRASRAQLSVSKGSNYLDSAVGPHASDAKVDACYKLKPVPTELTLARQPEDVSTNSEVARFVVQVAGKGAFEYQWQRNLADIKYANGPVFTQWTATAADGDKFRVIVRQGTQTVISHEANLRIVAPQPPVLLNVPGAVTVPPGGLLSLAVNSRGSGPLTYQWSFQGKNIDGATDPSLSVTGFAAANQGEYRVKVGNPGGAVVSDPWTVSLKTNVAELPTSNPVPDGVVLEVLSQILNVGELVDFASAAQAKSDGAIGFLWPTSGLCTSGSATLSVDGVRMIDGFFLKPDQSYGLVLDFNQCADEDDGVYNGSVSAMQRYTGNLTDGKRTRLQSTLTNFSVGMLGSGALFNGRIEVDTLARGTADTYQKVQVITPMPGANVRLPTNGTVLAFTGGFATVTEDAQFSQQTNVTSFTITRAFEGLSLSTSGTPFTASGSIATASTSNGNEETAPVYSGEMILKSGSVQVGRIFADSAGRLMMDIGGVVSVFSGL